MTDDQIDRFIDRHAAEYNQPPARVPREEMWAALQRERASRTREAGVTPLHRHRWLLTVAAIAAALVLGVLLGRGSTIVVPPAPQPQLASDNPNPPSTGGVERGSAPVSNPEAPSAPRVAIAERPSAVPSSARSASPAGRRPARNLDVEPADRSYEVATTAHLARMEALLTTFRTESRAGRVDGQLATWARDLLTTTRLLLDSPAAEDAKNRRLLEDLELVLVQLVNLAPDASATERGSIERTLENGQVMTRLRSAVPAGAPMSGT